MFRLRRTTFNRSKALVATGLLAMGITPLLAVPADTVRSRVNGYRELGAAFKGANDALRGTPQLPLLRQYARQITAASRNQYNWFPPGTGPGPGIRTSARPNVWTRPQDFRRAQDNFASAAQAFEVAARGTNTAAAKNAAKKLGATCKACHDAFRTETD